MVMTSPEFAAPEPAAMRDRSWRVPPASAGAALEPGVQQVVAPRFGRDFSQVRVHTDRAAAWSAERLGAAAYTVGRDIVFAPQRYRPTTEAGLRLLAHEL